MNPVNIRLLNQQLAAPQFSRPEEVVAHFGAMQAQEYRLMRWAVEMRTKNPSEKTFSKAFNEGKIIRLHLLRGTWQLVSAEDYWWMLELCGEKALQVINGWMSSNKISLPEEEILRVRDILVDETERIGSATKEDFVRALAEQGITMDDHRLSYHIRYAELSGTLCSGNLLSMKATYAMAEEKVKRTEPLDRDEALARLARKYFQSHQPATLEDFVWWSGMGVNDCRKAIGLLGQSIRKESFLGREFYLLDDCRSRGYRKGEVLLLPSYDEYLIGYKSRDVVLSPEFKHRAHNNSGIFQPIIAKDGVICGNWCPHKSTAEPSFFETKLLPQEIEKPWGVYQKYKIKNK